MPLTLIAGPFGNAVSPHLSGQPTGQEIADPLLHRLPASQAQGCPSPPHPPDGRIGVEVRAVARQIHRSQTKPGSPEVLRVDYVYPKKC